MSIIYIVSIFMGPQQAWLLTSVLMTHDCFLEMGKGRKEKKIFNKRTPDTKQHFTFVVVKKVTFYR